MRIAFACFLTTSALAATAALAETGTVSSSLTTSAFVDVSQRELPLNLTVGPVRGELTASSPEELYSTGASAFVQLKLSSEESTKRGVSAELLLEPEYGEIVDISGSDDDAKQDGGKHVARIEGIRKGRSRIVLIEMKLRAAEDSGVNRLKFALRLQNNSLDMPAKKDAKKGEEQDNKATRQMIALTWPMARCGDQYHAALRKIGEEGGNDLRKTWQAALRRDKSMSRRWMFSPSIPRRTARRKPDPEDDSISRREARNIYLKTRELMRRGYDSDLRHNGRYGWMISKTANDLRKYFSQEMNPAICTGALDFASYYETRLSPLRERSEKLGILARKAEQLAHEKAEEIMEIMRSLPGGHPAWGGASLIALKPNAVEPGDMKALAVNLLSAANFPQETIDRAAKTEDAYQALELIDDEGLKIEGLTKSLRADLDDAFAAIEAAVRLDAFRDRYEEFSQGFFGKLEAIRSAHARHCVCSR